MTNDDLKKLGELIDSKLDSKLERFGKEITRAIKTSQDQVVKVIVDYLDEHITPYVADSADKKEVGRLKRRVSEIESLPTIALELKVKRRIEK